jgi:hypothetical protein
MVDGHPRYARMIPQLWRKPVSTKPNKYQPRTNAGGAIVRLKLSDLKPHPLSREVREQVLEKFRRWHDENGMSAEPEPGFPVGEYLGDLEITDEMLAGLANINPFVNSIAKVSRGKYIVWADFDYSGDGHFIGLRLEPLQENEAVIQ